MKASCLSLAALLAAALLHKCGGVYVFQGNPFQQYGPFVVGTKILEQLPDGVPVYTEVFYPVKAGSYTPVLFISAFYGSVYPSFYSTAISNLASYGYVVASIDPYWPAAGVAGWRAREEGRGRDTWRLRRSQEEIKNNAERSFQLLQWLKSNLVSRVFPSEDVYNVTVDWSRLGLLSHSAGADTLIRMLQQNSTFAQAAAFLEPFSEHFKGPLPYSRPLPSLSYGTELCMEFPDCCIKGLSYMHFYNNLRCPRILMDVKGYGHCDILNEVPGWELCHDSGFCKTVKGNNRKQYREVFIPGLLCCFFGQYLQGNPTLATLITHPDDMPVQMMQLAADINCTLS